MTPESFSSNDLINERLLEEIRDDIRGGFPVVVDKSGYRGVAARVFIALSAAWKLSHSQAANLLQVSEVDYEAWKEGAVNALNAECMEKISCLMGIYRYLCILCTGHMKRVESWLLRENYGEYYGGRAPYELLVEIGMSAFHLVRRDLAAETI